MGVINVLLRGIHEIGDYLLQIAQILGDVSGYVVIANAVLVASKQAHQVLLDVTQALAQGADQLTTAIGVLCSRNDLLRRAGDATQMLGGDDIRMDVMSHGSPHQKYRRAKLVKRLCCLGRVCAIEFVGGIGIGEVGPGEDDEIGRIKPSPGFAWARGGKPKRIHRS